MSCGQAEQPVGRGLNFCLNSSRARPHESPRLAAHASLSAWLGRRDGSPAAGENGLKEQAGEPWADRRSSAAASHENYWHGTGLG